MMARDLQTQPPAAYRPVCGAIPVLAVAFLGLGDFQAPMRPESVHVVSVASANPLGQELAGLASAPVMPTNEKRATGNPLWAIPLGALSETAARPLFLSSRRPLTPSVVAAPHVPPTKPLPPPKEPDRPLLTLLGTIVGKSRAIAIFLDEPSRGVIRLRIGQVHGGWVLVSVHRRVASFERDHRQATVILASAGWGGAGVCDSGPIVGRPDGNCERNASPAPATATPPTANSRKKRWRDAADARAARNAR
jgi:general secretion pathway protein N